MAGIVPALVQVHVARPQGGGWKHLVLRRSLQDHEYPGLWQCITGRVAEGETAFEAAQRELDEEIGVAVHQWWSLPVVASYYDRHYDMLRFAVAFGAVVPPSARVRLTEHEDYRWLDCTHAQQMLPIPAQQEGVALLDRFLTDPDRRGVLAQLYRLR
ncbi:MAG: hypothetical protein KatS3mg039_1446 [Candidatus Kapaibacterium sp.]|nr:MAG: hypothetical protein KatS3mg039_1446 [Candidatus Kapabacteria bacterium]